jgi:hypothetical protein
MLFAGRAPNGVDLHVDEIDEALKHLFLALLNASPKMSADIRRQLEKPWELMSRRRRIISLMTVLLRQLDEST